MPPSDFHSRLDEMVHTKEPRAFWKNNFTGKTGLAPHSLTPATLVTAKNSDVQPSEIGPIFVEFVRGEDDVWSVLVDGVTHPQLKEGGGGSANSHAYELPPPIDSVSGACRELVVAARLECGALAPAKIEFVSELISDVSRGSHRYAVDEPVDIVPYAVEHPVANALVAPYPFVAPRLPLAAVVSFEESAR